MEPEVLNQLHKIEQPLLSVIVTCYNVEKYLTKCISTIVNQTYPNLEILLIDDGSPDRSGIICDEWQERDSRIRTIHKPHEGVSYARKTGIEYASADYITFVDADDWIDVNMYAHLMQALLSTDSDFAECGYYCVYEDGRIEPSPPQTLIQTREKKTKVYGRKEGMLLLLECKNRESFMWNKIFKKKLFDAIVFPKNLVYEDVLLMHVVFHHASQSVYLNDAYYFYNQRTNSICNPNTIQKTIIRNSHWANAHYNRYLFVKQHPQYHDALKFVKHRMMYHKLIFLRNLVDYPQFFPIETFKQQALLLKSIPLSYRDIPFFFKLDFLILKLFPRCYKPFYKIIYRNLTRIIRSIKKWFNKKHDRKIILSH